MDHTGCSRRFIGISANMEEEKELVEEIYERRKTQEVSVQGVRKGSLFVEISQYP